MDDRLAQLESRVEELTSSLHAVEKRLERLESTRLESTAGAGAQEVPEPVATKVLVDETVATGGDMVGVLSLVGRTFLVLAGAYLLRAMTSEGYLPQSLGVAAGLVYAALWIYMADRDGGRGRSLSAAFYAAIAVLLAVPLIWETTVRFAFLSATASAGALAGLAALTLWVAWRRRLTSAAWIVSLGAGTSAMVLGGSTHAPMPFAFFLVLVGVATWWLAGRRGWSGLAWVSAALADLAVLLLYAEDPIGRGTATLTGVVTIELLLFVLYLASFSYAAWRACQGVTLFTVLQTMAVFIVGYGAAVELLRRHGAAAALAIAGLVVAVGLYAAAFLGLERQRRRSALFFTSVAIPLVLVGSALILPRPAFLWALLALGGSALGSRFHRLTPSLHGAVYALAACLASGLLRQTADAWTMGSFSAVSIDSLLALGATAACLAFPVSGDMSFWRRYAHLPKLVFLVLVVAASGGLLVRAAAAVFPASVPPDPGALATLRTAVLSIAALVLAAAGRLEHLREALVLVYPVLVLGAVKLLVEDFPAGRPETLFIALAFYGGALIVAPRLRRAAHR